MSRKQPTAVSAGTRGNSKRPEVAQGPVRAGVAPPARAPRYVARLAGARGSCLCR